MKGTATGAITDMDGNFKIQAAKGDVLEISLYRLCLPSNHVDQCPAIENNNGGRYTKIG
ncbi:hypothetical protein NXX71_05165 [Bacteroides faecis]|nr:hypothetical protein [Bacteroides faecis]